MQRFDQLLGDNIFYDHDFEKLLSDANDKQTGATVFAYHVHDPERYGVAQCDDSGKLVRVVEGAVFDVVVDLRRSSPSFGQWTSAILSAENQQQLWIPQGFAHGFLTLTDTAQFLYKTTDYYAPQAEQCIAWNDPQIGIVWPKLSVAPVLSAKDQMGALLSAAECFD